MKRGAADLLTILLTTLAIAAAGSGGYAYMLWDEAQGLEKSLPQDEKDLKTAIGLRDDLQDIKNRGGGADVEQQNSIQSFFYGKAKDRKIEISKISVTKSTFRNQWDETAYTIEIKNVSRQQLGQFMVDVEKERPFLKSKEIRDARYDEKYEDCRFITSVTVVFSYFQRMKK